MLVDQQAKLIAERENRLYICTNYYSTENLHTILKDTEVHNTQVKTALSLTIILTMDTITSTL